QQQKMQSLTDENLYFYIQPLILLAELKEEKSFQVIINVLSEINDNMWFISNNANSNADIYIIVKYGENSATYPNFSKKIAKAITNQSILEKLILNHNIHSLIRRNVIEKIAHQVNYANIYISTFLTELIDSAAGKTVRTALAAAIGELATDEQTLTTLL